MTWIRNRSLSRCLLLAALTVGLPGAASAEDVPRIVGSWQCTIGTGELPVRGLPLRMTFDLGRTVSLTDAQGDVGFGAWSPLGEGRTFVRDVLLQDVFTEVRFRTSESVVRFEGTDALIIEVRNLVTEDGVVFTQRGQCTRIRNL